MAIGKWDIIGWGAGVAVAGLFLVGYIANDQHRTSGLTDASTTASQPAWHGFAPEAYVCTYDKIETKDPSMSAEMNDLGNSALALGSLFAPSMPPLYLETDPLGSKVSYGTFRDNDTFDRARDVSDWTTVDISTHDYDLDPDSGKPFEVDGAALKKHEINSIDITATQITTKQESWFTYSYSGKEISSTDDDSTYDRDIVTLTLDKSAGTLVMVVNNISKNKQVTIGYKDCVTPQAYHAESLRKNSTSEPNTETTNSDSATDAQ